MIELICIGCPRGCKLLIDENNDYTVTGHSCQIGVEYGKNEVLNPTRVLTTIVKIENAIHNCLPVKSSKPLPKEKLIEVSKALKEVVVKSPVKTNEIIVKNILNTGIDIVATRDM
ncbi:MAG TPA: DUF1667 domain-containing protein [Erysipelotrichaceae bacterium]|jgi:CxxC motif-containing protein|nr:DUF1667 domain-containing protein [Erysipelotrichia bacterium]HPX31918.1 DUF1667 domain-containing protein [Erysipelotrichaceae bacterium]HQA84430.1 DUF1667 domain-containing protein [Erysipelotrichaceae bacterium]